MKESWGRVTPKFSQVLDQLPILSEYGFRGLRGGELLAVRTPTGWAVESQSDPRKVNPSLWTVYLSKGRETGEPGLAFETIKTLSYVLYDTPSDPPGDARGGSLVAATWYHPRRNWHINRPAIQGEEVGFPTTEGMWGTIDGPEFQAEGVVVVCTPVLSARQAKERSRKIRRGGFPGPKDWSPSGRLPGDY